LCLQLHFIFFGILQKNETKHINIRFYSQKKNMMSAVATNANATFEEEKAQMLEHIMVVIVKILFDETLPDNLEKAGLGTLGSYIRDYNANILKARRLRNELSRLEKWGMFCNGRMAWRYAVYKSIGIHMEHIKTILEYISSTQHDFIRNTIMRQNSVVYKNMELFMVNVHKINNRYVLVKSDDDFVLLNAGQIENLMPQYMDTDKMLKNQPAIVRSKLQACDAIVPNMNNI
jgi:hypothetical protein